jgi:translation initiation factor IF-2
MSESKDQERKTPLSLARPGKLELKKTVETGQVRQSFSHGRSKVVTVEVRKKRTFTAGAGGAMHEVKEGIHSAAEADLAAAVAKVEAASRAASVHDLTNHEKAARARALQDALKFEEDARHRAEEEAIRHAEESARLALEEAERARIAAEEAARIAAAEALNPTPPAPVEVKAPEAPVVAAPAQPERPAATTAATPAVAAAAAAAPRARTDEEEEEEERAKKRAAAHKAAPVKRNEPRRRTGKLTITAALDDNDKAERGRSLAAVKRARERERLKHMQRGSEKVVRDVIIPESITVQELANRMAERGVDVIKTLMRMGVMATINQSIDADTAELAVAEFGHTFKRVSDSDVLVGLGGEADSDEEMMARPPVVTIMGHVDHGKTSLLDALRETDVVSGEAGGITQHIGAYQVTLTGGAKITFIDTPGHEAFTAMRARGAKVTDIVVLVVAADDGIMPQTVEAIRHAKAAGVPLIVAINKIDKPDANPEKVRQELLQHELVTEELGGDILAVELSAKKRINLDKLEEAILLQAEILDLKANPRRLAAGTVVEAKMEKGRGAVATVLVQKGTLRVGDVFVAGAESGRVRALVDHLGNRIEEAGPSTPVEVLGLNGVPAAGDEFVAVEDEGRAREIASYRQRKDRETKSNLAKRGTLEEMFSAIKAGEAKELPIVIKGDVQGSVEAINATVAKLGNETVKVRVLHAAVGAINESDVTLAKATNGLIFGFNVRANPQARDMARRDGIDIRYYSIIYDVTDDLKKMLSGMLAPTLKERFLGYAEIREVFNITKHGKVAGCRVTEGNVKRGAKVRLLRDNVVIHEGDLGQLKRFKDDVKEVAEGYECGMSFANYEDIRAGDVIECFEIEEVAGVL